MEYQISSLSVLLASFVFMFVVLRSKWRKSNPPRQLPGPWKLPLVGNMHQLYGDLPHRRFRDLAQKYGPLMHIQLGEISNIIISSPEMAKQVLVKHDVTFANRPYQLESDILFYNCSDLIFAPYGDYWRQLRKICMVGLLSSKRVQAMQPIREQEVSKFIKSISSKAGSEINLGGMLVSLTYDIILKATFGGKGEDHKEFLPLAKQIIAAYKGYSLADIFPSITLLRKINGSKARLERLRSKVDKFLDNIINERKVENLETTANSTTKEEANDLLQVLLNLLKDGLMSIDNVKAVILDIFLGGTDSSSTMVEWAMSELLRNPELMKRAQKEVRHFCDKKGYVDEASLDELKLLKLIVKEILRLRPTAPLLIPRQGSERVVIDGYEIPIKSKIIINAWALGRDPDYWVESERFNPDRFLDTTVDFKGTNFEYIPFGAGRRMCPGLAIGVANIELVLAQLLYHFDWKLPDHIKPRDLDMTEIFSLSVKKKEDLCVIPTPYLRPMHMDG